MIEKLIKGDNCSAVPEFMMSPCCKKHDSDYETEGKFKADWNFLKCGWDTATTFTSVSKRVATRFVSTSYFLGVSLFGFYSYYKANGRLF